MTEMHGPWRGIRARPGARADRRDIDEQRRLVFLVADREAVS
jgi:hypothetical protein